MIGKSYEILSSRNDREDTPMILQQCSYNDDHLLTWKKEIEYAKNYRSLLKDAGIHMFWVSNDKEEKYDFNSLK